MAKRPAPPAPQSPPLDATRIRKGLMKLDRRIVELESFDINTINERADPKASALLAKITDTVAEIFDRETIEFRDHSVWSLDTLPLTIGGQRHSLSEVRAGYQKGVERALSKLTTLREMLQEKLDDMEAEETMVSGDAPAAKAPPNNRRIFIVHGHDELAKETVARFVAQLDLEPVILHEQPSGGRTIIEKLEGHIDVAFAIVLLTPDDVGYAVGKQDEARPRARQNVMLELGLFIGVLGRHRVCALHKGGVEIPSDYSGVAFVDMSIGDSWKLLLAREIRHAGLEVDMNNAL